MYCAHFATIESFNGNIFKHCYFDELCNSLFSPFYGCYGFLFIRFYYCDGVVLAREKKNARHCAQLLAGNFFP